MLKVSIFSEENKTRKGAGEPHQEEDFPEVRRRKRQNTEETANTVKKAAVRTKTPQSANTSPKEVATRNFFAPLRATGMDTDSSGIQTNPEEEAVLRKTCRPPQ